MSRTNRDLSGLTEWTPLRAVMSAREAKRFAESREQITTVADLLETAPKSYLNQDEATDFRTLVEGERATVVAEVLDAKTQRMRQRAGSLLLVTLGDSRGGTLKLTFFKPFGHQDKLVPGRRGVFNGVVSSFRHELQLTHPDYAMLDDATDSGLAAWRGYLLPIYRETGGNPSPAIRRAVMVCLQMARLSEPVPEQVYAGRGLLSHRDALWAVHRPATREEAREGTRRLRYDEALTLQVIIARRRAELAGIRTTARVARPDGLLAAFDAELPYALTPGQRAAGEQIFADLARPTPMHRLLQGEVGSGKTVVALRAMLAMVDAGAQAALLAPTEVLAAQHLRSIRQLLGDLSLGGLFGGFDGFDGFGGPVGTKVVLLTGSQSVAARRQALADAASGAAGIVVGTHALIQRDVQFADLGLVVVDEQHRFGVEQRDALRDKGITPPHTLVMTATPIPRTVAMTVFGDLETTTLRELPSGRIPITTHVVDESMPGWFDRVWARVGEEVRAARQVFVVAPKIGDSEDDTAEADAELTGSDQDERHPPRGVYEIAALLAARPELDGVRIGVLHGRLDAESKETVMTAFAAGALDVLVATTVIEVGVDVPNATLMVVIDADRFGVSQLHQLRGRIGRGEHPGLCLLTTRSQQPAARERLAAVASTTDGFRLAELDVRQRREGDVLGARQSGRSSLRFLRVTHPEDEVLIAWARADATAIVAKDPQLDQHVDLDLRVRTRLDAEQAAYLDRG